MEERLAKLGGPEGSEPSASASGGKHPKVSKAAPKGASKSSAAEGQRAASRATGKRANSKKKSSSKALPTPDVVRESIIQQYGQDDLNRLQTVLPYTAWAMDLTDLVDYEAIGMFILKDLVPRIVTRGAVGLGPCQPTHIIPRIMWSRKGLSCSHLSCFLSFKHNSMTS